MCKWNPSAYVALALLLVASPAAAQERSAGAGAPAADDYRIGPGDVLSIGVTGVPELTRVVRVSNSGKVHLQFLGILRVVDMTVLQLEATIADALRERRLMDAPWVTVRIDEYRSQPVYILGEVLMPGQFVIKREMYLTDLIALAQGFNDVASPVGYLYRRHPDTGNLPVGEAQPDDAIAIDFKALSEGRNPELNYRLRGGDVLHVPQAPRRFFYVVGDVRRVGAFEMNGDSLLVSQALSLAGGPLRTAKGRDSVLVRQGPNGATQELPVDFDAILRGRKPDFTVRADDIIFIPGSAAKTLTYATLGLLPSMLSQRAAENAVR